jgi:hypothetical protein
LQEAIDVCILIASNVVVVNYIMRGGKVLLQSFWKHFQRLSRAINARATRCSQPLIAEANAYGSCWSIPPNEAFHRSLYHLTANKRQFRWYMWKVEGSGRDVASRSIKAEAILRAGQAFHGLGNWISSFVQVELHLAHIAAQQQSSCQPPR